MNPQRLVPAFAVALISVFLATPAAATSLPGPEDGLSLQGLTQTVRVDVALVDGAPMATTQAALPCTVSASADVTSGAYGGVITCVLGSDTTTDDPAHCIELSASVESGAGGWGSASSACRDAGVGCYASGGTQCAITAQVDSPDPWTCSFYGRAPYSASCSVVYG